MYTKMQKKKKFKLKKKSYINTKMFHMNQNYMTEDQEIRKKNTTSRTISSSCRRQAHAQLNKQ